MDSDRGPATRDPDRQLKTGRIVKCVSATLGQRSQWYEQKLFLPSSHSHLWNVSLFWHLGDGIDRATVTRAVHDLVGRHQALRTTFSMHDDGTLMQNVHESHPPLLHEPMSDGVHDSASLGNELAGSGFDLEQDLPVRFGVLGDRESIHTLCCVGNHIVFDGWTARIIKRDLNQLLTRQGMQQTLLQPCDIATLEHSSEGVAQTARCMRYWRQQLQQIPASLFPGLRTTPDTRMPDWRIRGLAYSTLKSPALYHAVTWLEATTKMPKAAVLLAAYVALLTHYTDNNSVPLKLVTANRADRKTWDTAVCLAQPVLIHCRTDKSFRALVRNCYSAMLKGHRYGRYDGEVVNQLVTQESRTRREPVYIERFFDFFWSDPNGRREENRSVAPEFNTSISEMHTSAEWVDHGPEQSLRIRSRDDCVLITFCADVDQIPSPVGRRILLGIENIVIRACQTSGDQGENWLSQTISKFVQPRTRSGL